MLTWQNRDELVLAATNWLVVEQPLERATAIVALDGGSPEREREAAALYTAGWAPKVVVVPGQSHADARDPTDEWASRYRLLESLGVPSDAIVVADGHARRTLDELRLAQNVVPNDGPVILVTSSLHTRRVATIWSTVTRGAQRGIVRGVAPTEVASRAKVVTAAAHELTGLMALVGQAHGLL
jgi:uncharacterized SAM-binding protein YcdF (DUF218 family)